VYVSKKEKKEYWGKREGEGVGERKNILSKLGKLFSSRGKNQLNLAGTGVRSPFGTAERE